MEEFFCFLDEQTSSSRDARRSWVKKVDGTLVPLTPAEKSERRHNLACLKQFLNQRLFARALGERPCDEVSARVMRAAMNIESVFFMVFECHFRAQSRLSDGFSWVIDGVDKSSMRPGHDDTVDLKGLESAFEKFANGEFSLRRRKGPLGMGEPATGYLYFLFSELALLLAECGGARRALWRQLAQILIRTIWIFGYRYQEGHDGIAADVNFNTTEPRGPLSDSVLGRLRKTVRRWTFDDFDDEFCALTQRCFRNGAQEMRESGLI